MSLKKYDVLVGEDLLDDDLHWATFTVGMGQIANIILAAFESGLEVLIRERKIEE